MRLLNNYCAWPIVLFIGWFGLSGPVFATRGSTEVDSYTFMRMQSSIRAAALGDTFVAIADDPSAVLLNPAGLPRLAKAAAQLSHNSWLIGTSYSNLIYTKPFWKNKAFGLALTYFNFGEIAETTRNQPLGTGRSIVSSATEYNVAYGYSPNETISFGAVIKLVRQSIAGVNDYNSALNLGLLVDLPNEIRLGCAAQNIGYSSFNNISLGVSGRVWEKVLLLGGEVRALSGDITSLHFGAEYDLKSMMLFRLGYSTSSQERAGGDWTIGLGLKYAGVIIDYAYIPFEVFDNTHRIGLKFDL